jgi:hypothetical protein
MVISKMICLEWHFGQVGHGGNKIIWEVFLLEFLFKKVVISCSVLFCFYPSSLTTYQLKLLKGTIWLLFFMENNWGLELQVYFVSC